MGLLNSVFRLFLVSLCGSFLIGQSDDSLAKLEKLRWKFSRVASEILPNCSNRLDESSRKAKKELKNSLRSASLRQLVREFNEIKRNLSKLVQEINPVCTLELNPALGLRSVKLARRQAKCRFTVAANSCGLLYIPAAFVMYLQSGR